MGISPLTVIDTSTTLPACHLGDRQMTDYYGSDGRAITNSNTANQGDQGALQAQASNLMMRNRPGLGNLLGQMAQRPVQGQAMEGRMDPSAQQPANGSLEVPQLFGNVEFRMGMGAGVQVPPNQDAYSYFQPTLQRHGNISWQNGRPIWKDLDYRNTPAIYGDVDPVTKNLQFRIDVPTNTSAGARRETITIKQGQNSDGSIQAEMVSTYPFGRFQVAPRAMYSGGVQMLQEASAMQQQPPQQQSGDALGSVMPGTPMNDGRFNGGMDPRTMAGNMRNDGAPNYGNTPESQELARLRQENARLQQQTQQMENQKPHPYRDAALGLGLMGAQAVMRNLNGYGGFGGYGYGRGPLGGLLNGRRRR